MKPDENIEKFVKDAKPRVTTGSPMDKRTLDDSFAAMEKTIQGRADAERPTLSIMLLRSRAMQLAAAAVIILAVIMSSLRETPLEQYRPPTTGIAESATEKLTMMSLRMAYSRGGIEAVDNQSAEAYERLGIRSANISIQELFANGV